MKSFTVILLFVCFSIFPSFGQSSDDCIFNRQGNDAVANRAALQDYLDCLVDCNMQEKNKTQLLTSLKGKGIRSKFVNTMQMYSDHYVDYQSLLRLSIIEDLEEMVLSEVAEWRYYGFLGLAEKQETDVFSTLKVLLNDQTKVRAKMGCSPEKNTISHYCIQAVTLRYIFEEENYQSEVYQLTPTEKKELDALLAKK